MNNFFQRQVGATITLSEHKHCLLASCLLITKNTGTLSLKGFSEFIYNL